MNIAEIWNFELRRGASDDPRNGACFLDAVSWFNYGHLGDQPPCVCPVIAAYGIGVNDALPQTERQRLKPYIVRLPGTVDPTAERARAEYLAWQAVHVFAPLVLDALDPISLRDFRGTMDGAVAALRNAAITARAACETLCAVDAKATRYASRDAAAAATWVVRYSLRTAKYGHLDICRLYAEIFATLDGLLAIGKQAPQPDIARFKEAADSFARAATAACQN